MPSDLAQHIEAIRAIDTHSHMQTDVQWAEDGPRDILPDLFRHYGKDDLVVAGATVAAVERFLDDRDPDIESRFAAVAEAWGAMRFTGYGEAVRIAARDLYGIEELSGPALRAAGATLDAFRTPAGAYHILHDRANLDHIQIDSGLRLLESTPEHATFYLRDLSWVGFVEGDVSEPRREMLASITGETITDLASLRRTMEAVFALFGPRSIAVKSQHAYGRTLAWQERDDSDAARALHALLAGEPGADEPESAARLCVGDWCLARGAELAAQYDLPFKLHTGYLAGAGIPRGTFVGSVNLAGTHDRLPLHRLRAAHLTPLLTRYPATRFVLMHIAYPYDAEVLAVAKHFPNAYVDLCWAWSIDPATTTDFVRRWIHTAPINKLFGFGDDTGTPTMAYGYAVQMRRWLTRTLEREVADDLLTVAEAKEIATRLLRTNAQACFPIEATQGAMRAAVEAATEPPWPYRYRAAATMRERSGEQVT